MKIILSKRGNDIWECIQAMWMGEAIFLYFLVLNLL